MKILFVHQGLQSFVVRDAEILKSKHDVKLASFTPLKGAFFRLIPDCLGLLNGVLWCDVVFCWFGKLHAFCAMILCKIFNKKLFVVAGGDDAGIWRYNGKTYGICALPLKRFFARAIFKNADRIIAVSNSNYKEVLSNTGAVEPQVELIYHGFNPGYYTRDVLIAKKRKMALTICTVDEENYYRKGLFLFAAAAKALHDYEFYIVGQGAHKALFKELPGNVKLTGPKYGKELIDILSCANIYVQASLWESFGCALAEAMLCECIPVVSDIPAIREVAGEEGYYLKEFTSEALAESIVSASESGIKGVRFRERIQRLFPIERRREDLLGIIKKAGIQ